MRATRVHLDIIAQEDLISTSTIQLNGVQVLLRTEVFGYFAGRRGARYSLLGAGCNLRNAGCEMLSLISELQTCQEAFVLLMLSQFIDKKCLSHVLLRYTSRTNRIPHPAPRKPCPAACKLHSTK